MTKEELNNAAEYWANFFQSNKDEALSCHSQTIECMASYAQSIVLGKLPGDDECHKKANGVANTMKLNDGVMRELNSTENLIAIMQYSNGMKQMRSIATQSIRTEDEVTKPYRELLEEIADSETTLIPNELYERINQLLNGSR